MLRELDGFEPELENRGGQLLKLRAEGDAQTTYLGRGGGWGGEE
ncbi:hypothetical protein BH20ACT13_BH20ACT13_22020 [soil metagenome]